MAGNNSVSRTIASRYAEALFAMAKEQKKIDEIGAQLEAFVGIIQKNSALNNAVNSPLTNRTALSGAASDIAQTAGADAALVKAVALMGKAGRLSLIDKVLAAYNARLAEEKGIVVATVITATSLKAPQRKKIEAGLKQSLGTDVSLDLQVDEKVIGGLLIKVGSKLLDYSVRGRLTALQAQLHNAA